MCCLTVGVSVPPQILDHSHLMKSQIATYKFMPVHSFLHKCINNYLAESLVIGII